MTSLQEKYQERLARTKRAINLEKQDRVPFAYFADSFSARATGTTIAQYLQSPEKAAEVNQQAIKMLGDVDINVLAVPPTLAFPSDSDLCNWRIMTP